MGQPHQTSLVDQIKKHWFGGLITLMAIVVGGTWTVADKLRVEPRDFTIEQQKSQIAELEQRVNLLQAAQANSQPAKTPQSTSPQNCPVVTGSFAHIWVNIRDTIGCATSSVVNGFIAEQNFQGGKLVWRGRFDNKQIIMLLSNGKWQTVKYRSYIWGEDPLYSCPDEHTPSKTPPTPKDGFGMVWCNIPAVRETMGNAVDKEDNHVDDMQQFEQGFIFKSGDHTTIYILYGSENGNWERK